MKVRKHRSDQGGRGRRGERGRGVKGGERGVNLGRLFLLLWCVTNQPLNFSSCVISIRKWCWEVSPEIDATWERKRVRGTYWDHAQLPIHHFCCSLLHKTQETKTEGSWTYFHPIVFFYFYFIAFKWRIENGRIKQPFPFNCFPFNWLF